MNFRMPVYWRRIPISISELITSQILGVAGPLGENVDISSLLGFDVQTNSDHKTHKIKTQSVKALKRYLNKKNLIQGRVVATISKFIPKSFETCF